MDDLTPHKKKKLSGIRRLGKFFGLGGSASKSETKSQIDDCEEFDSSSTNDNTIESIMALKPEERILPPILNPEPQLFIQTVTVSNSFKPKALPPSLNRIPGRSSTSPRSIENNLQNPSSTASSPRSLEEINSEISEIQSQSQQNQPQTQDDSQQNQKPQQPPKPQRIEDIIRLKLPLARKSSRLLNTQKSTDSTPEVRVDTNEKKNIILEDDKSPVSNTFIDNYSPIVLNEQKNAQQNLLKSTSQDLIQSTNTRTSPISPKANESPSLKILPTNNDKIEDIKNINTRKDIDNNNNDNNDNDNEDNFSKNLLIESININTIDSTDSYLDITHTLNDTESLRSNSIDNDGTRDRSGSTSLQKYSSRDSEDSLPITLNIDILKEPVAIKTKDDLRAEFLSFRLSSKSKIVSPESILDPVKSRSNELNESKISEENDEDNDDDNGDDDDSVSSYGSDEIDLLNTYSDDVEEQEQEEERKVKENLSSTTSSSIPSGSFYDLNITHMLISESIPEGDENDDDGDDIDKKYQSKDNKKDNIDLTPIKITSVVTKRQSISHNESKQKSNQNKRLSMSSIPSDSNKDDKKINKQILHAPIDKSSSLPMPIPPPQQANQTTKTSKQRSKSILSTPNNQSNINSGWNNSTKSITTTNNTNTNNNTTNNNLPGQKTTSSTLKSRRQSNNIAINTSTSITSSSFSSSSSSMTINSIAPFSNPTTPATTPTTLNLNGDIRQLQQSFSNVSNSSNTDYLSPRSATSISSNSSKPTTPTTPTTPSSNKSPNNFNSNISTNQLNHDPDSPDLKITTKRISSSNSTRLSTDNKRKSIAIGEKLNKF